jgi:hypothetical protein
MGIKIPAVGANLCKEMSQEARWQESRQIARYGRFMDILLVKLDLSESLP